MSKTTRTPVLKDGKLENFTVHIKGKMVPCPAHCGCNVFHKPDDTRPDLYQCNGCGVEFEGV